MRFIDLFICLTSVMLLSLSPFTAHISLLTESKITPTNTNYRSEVISMQVTIDRFEGDMAVLELPDRTTKDIARKLLPPQVKEGDVLLEKDGEYFILESETKARAGEIEDLMEKVWED